MSEPSGCPFASCVNPAECGLAGCLYAASDTDLRAELQARAEKAEARQREAEAIRDRMAIDLNVAQTKLARQGIKEKS